MTVLEFYDKLSKPVVDDVYAKALGDYLYKIYDAERDYKWIDILDDDKFKVFIRHTNLFYMIPLRNVHNNIFGFVCRDIDKKKFYNILLDEKYPLVFGLEQMKSFEFNKTIILCEGIKDILVVRRLYPYSLAYLTSEPSDTLWDYLSHITNRIIFFPDKDYAGMRFVKDERMKKKLILQR